MPSVTPIFGHPGMPISYTAVEAITGGRLVERRAGTRLVGMAAAGSLKVAGVAAWDVPVTRATIQGPQVGDGHELKVFTNCVIEVTFVAAAVEGDQLIAAANGQVTPLAAAAGAVAADINNARAIVGYAFEAVGAGAQGLMRVRV